MNLPVPFLNTREYRAAFARGLGHILQHDKLGTFILALANATFDREIHHILKSQLTLRYAELSDHLRVVLREGRPLDHASDDLLVFLKLMAVGFRELQMTGFRKAGPWEIQFNQLRSFRPTRLSSNGGTGLHLPFDADGFHFNKPFLAREILWEGELLGRHCRLLYNKFPFAELHGLLVINPTQNRPQFLEADEHRYVWQLLETLGDSMPGAGFAFNSCGAYASVNHQHFQMFVRDRGRYPIEEDRWLHKGGSQAYPVDCQYFTSVETAWSFIESLHLAGRSYNLLYRPAALYVVPRAVQGSFDHADWTGGFAWAEIVGSLTTFNAGDYESLSEEQILTEFSKLGVPLQPPVGSS